MASKRNYVSNELTHFVGRSVKSREQRYALLLRILREGRLICKEGTGLTNWSLVVVMKKAKALRETMWKPSSGTEKQPSKVQSMHCLHLANATKRAVAFRKTQTRP